MKIGKMRRKGGLVFSGGASSIGISACAGRLAKVLAIFSFWALFSGEIFLGVTLVKALGFGSGAGLDATYEVSPKIFFLSELRPNLPLSLPKVKLARNKS